MGLTNGQKVVLLVALLGLLVAGGLWFSIPVSTAEGACGTPADPEAMFFEARYAPCASAIDQRGTLSMVIAGLAVLGAVIGLIAFDDRTPAETGSPAPQTASRQDEVP